MYQSEAYLDESSIEFEPENTMLPQPGELEGGQWIAWYTDQDGVSLGYAEFDTREEIPSTYDAEDLLK